MSEAPIVGLSVDHTLTLSEEVAITASPELPRQWLRSTACELRLVGAAAAAGDRAFESEFAAGDLQALDEFAGAHEQHPPSVLDEGEADRCG